MSGRRPALRRVAWLSRWFLLLALLLWLAARLWALHQVRAAVPDFEARHGSIDPARWSLPAAASGVRAGRFLRAASLVFDREESDRTRWLHELRQAAQRSPDASVSAEILTTMTVRNAQALALVREAAAETSCVLYESLPSPYGEDPIDPFALLELARIERQSAIAALDRGDAAVAEKHLMGAFTLSHCLRDSPLQIPALVGLAVERSNLHLLRRLIESGRLVRISDSLQSKLNLARDFRGFDDTLAAEAAMFQPSPERRRGRGLPLPEAPPHSWNPWSVPGISEAGTLRAISRGIDALKDSAPPRPEKRLRVLPWRLDELYFSLFADGWWFRARRLEAHAGAWELALLATTLASASTGGAGEAELDDLCRRATTSETALLGERIEVVREPTGDRVISLPLTGARWTALNSESEAKVDLPWTWRIPSHSPATP